MHDVNHIQTDWPTADEMTNRLKQMVPLKTEWPKNFGGLIDTKKQSKTVVFCIPTLSRPHQACLDSLQASLPSVQASGWSDFMVSKIGCPYISAARSLMLRQALDANADVIVFIDHDLSWQPSALLRLIETPGDVVAGTYRFKTDDEEYMGRLIPGIDGKPIVREDGCIKAFCIPAGFMKITRAGVSKFMEQYPELVYGDKTSPHVDLFNHGVHKGVWYGEDYSFSRNWLEKCGDIWLIPNIEINHHSATKKYPGNFHRFLLRQPGGSDFKEAA